MHQQGTLGKGFGENAPTFQEYLAFNAELSVPILNP
jgi:hypothetical protein